MPLGDPEPAPASRPCRRAALDAGARGCTGGALARGGRRRPTRTDPTPRPCARLTVTARPGADRADRRFHARPTRPPVRRPRRVRPAVRRARPRPPAWRSLPRRRPGQLRLHAPPVARTASPAPRARRDLVLPGASTPPGVHSGRPDIAARPEHQRQRHHRDPDPRRAVAMFAALLAGYFADRTRRSRTSQSVRSSPASSRRSPDRAHLRRGRRHRASSTTLQTRRLGVPTFVAARRLLPR